jgi:cell division protein FtsA
MVANRNRLVAALDVGTSKVCCFVAKLDDHERPRVVGIGHHVSKGVKSGTVVDMDEAEGVIRATVEAAERMAGERIHDVYVNVSSGRPKSETFGVEVSTAGHEIGEADIRGILEAGRNQFDGGDRLLLHALPVGYAVDGVGGVREPRGLFGDKLSVDMHVVTTAASPVRNLQLCIERGHLGVADMCITPYASGLACLEDEETDMGVICLDMGGGTTSIAVFVEGSFVFTDIVPIGGSHITNDIAKGLLTPIVHAERIKSLHGSATAGVSDEQTAFTVPQLGAGGAESSQTITRAALNAIIRPRVQEILEHVRDRLKASGFDKIAGNSVVLTGGGAQLTGICEITTEMLGRQVRVGKPRHLAGLAEATSGPAFAACAGLVRFAEMDEPERAPAFDPRNLVAGVWRLGRIGRWLRDNF